MPTAKVDKPGYYTSEFGITALVIAGIVVLILFDKMTVQQISEMWPMFIGTGAYVVSRGIAKR